MARINISDFFLKLGFDASEVEKGLAQLDKKLAKTSMKAVKAQSKEVKTQAGTQKKITNELKKQNALESKQLQLRKALARLSPDVRREFRGATRLKDPDKIQEKILQAQRIQQMAAEDIAKHKVKAAIAADKVAAKELRAKEAAKEQLAIDKEKAKVKNNQIRLLSREANAMIANARKQEALDAKRIRTGGSIRGAGRAASRRLGGVHPKVKGEVQDLMEDYKRLERKAKDASDPKTFARLSNEMKRLNGETSRLVAKNNELTKSLRKSAFAANAMKDSMRNMARSYMSVFAVTAGAGATGILGQDLISAKATLLASSGSQQVADKDFEFVKRQSQIFGTSLKESVKGFAKINAATQLAGLTAETTRSMFIGLNEAATSFGLTQEQTVGVTKAYSDMLS